MAWTDERMDDMATQMREGFATVDADIRDVRAEIKDIRAELHVSVHDLRAEIRDVRAELKAEIAAVRTGMNRWAVVIVATMLGLFGVNLVPGVGG